MPHNKDAMDVAVEEYNVLWSYYGRTLDERERLFTNYLKIVALPSGVLLGLSVTYNLKESIAPSVSLASSAPFVGVLLFVLSLVGVSAFLAYAHETRNSRRFLSSINSIRDFFKNEYPILQTAFTVDQSNQLDPKQRIGSTAFYRGGMFLLANSSIFGIGIFLFSGNAWISVSASIIKMLFLIKAYRSIVVRRPPPMAE